MKNETAIQNRNEIAKKLHTALAAIDITTIEIASNDRHIPRKEQAKLARELFKKLGLKGISVTTPNYSMAQSVDVSIPSRNDYKMIGQYDIDPECEACKANHEARERIEAILLAAFPNHDNRSDSQTDYFDYCWSFNS
jgi:membrane protease subunit (stomatin/prohibitin family)